ncbi:DNA phosphorothioation-dependent restriction protein DptF [Pseudomonas panipatensis]|uniref:DNA phosphorothioation-dependent restriction protein DptF n=1 Tax=Pseudomonas panipatensis TaxID=428992 RepID=A0A1G8G4Z8_9PSED|nr:DNA phosphorothioation-dependent restriction protein DptF [Pseudomonas panipatensis]SDH89427.1 DNA phosphorothioation-dependent restriction protein DptF [Pseudomonas panipatensis]SMP45342.1 DNA phosphorothioation-dependent restriction protein DptF [Pseudomonas panipatensis]
MTTMTLRTALSVLAKSSPFSVKTVSRREIDEFDELKDQLYVAQEIEHDFSKILESLQSGEIVFLCGSSGDGKSEILARSYDKYKDKYKFHLDATHSFAPHQSAIEALDELFDGRQIDDKPLVIGINVGMLANFSKEGSVRHNKIIEKIDSFLTQGNCSKGNVHFIDFEGYPKFQLSKDGQGQSEFAKKLMHNLTRQDSDNLFYQYACKAESAGEDLQLVANFKLLSLNSVQDVIVTQLLKARLIKDQFITTRALLDLLHHILLGPGYIFDNLYVGDGNELVQRLSDFDPARKHTRGLDQFVLRAELSLPDPDLDIFISSLAANYVFLDRQNVHRSTAASLVRLFSLIRDEPMGNNYHQRYRHEFDEELLLSYSRIWALHKEYDGSTEMKMELRRFYTGELIAAILRYANRNAPELILVKDEIFLGEFGAVRLTAPVDLKCDYEAIKESPCVKSSQFLAHVKVFEKEIGAISMSFNLYELIYKLNRGYRPNKYDKNSIVLLDEVVDQIKGVVKLQSSLKFYDDNHAYVAKLDDDMITVSGVA